MGGGSPIPLLLTTKFKEMETCLTIIRNMIKEWEFLNDPGACSSVAIPASKRDEIYMLLKDVEEDIEDAVTYGVSIPLSK